MVFTHGLKKIIVKERIKESYLAALFSVGKVAIDTAALPRSLPRPCQPPRAYTKKRGLTWF